MPAKIGRMPPMQTPSRSLGRLIWLAILGAVVLVSSLPVRGADKRIVLIAGKPSHPPGMHEFRAGCLLLQKCLAGVDGIRVNVYSNGWPHIEGAFDQADA